MRPIVFFDLDETLVSTTVGGTRVRPGVVDVLEALRKDADLFVFSAASPASIDHRLRATRLDRFFFGTFSTRAPTDFRFVRGRPWVLVDDTNAEEKLERIDPTAVPEHHLIKVVPFTGQASSLKRYLPVIRERACFRTNGSRAHARALIDAGMCGDFDDDNFYHVTTESRLDSIARQGLVPGKPAKFSRLEDYSAGKVFVSHGLATARVWAEYIRDMVDEDEQVVILRIRPEAKLYSRVYLDEKGTEDAGCSFYVTSTIKPQHLEFIRTNTRDARGRFIPEKYLAGLPDDLRRARVRELGESRDAYRRGAFISLQTDEEARQRGLVKKSAYSEVAEKRGIEWQGDAADMAERVCDHYGVACSPAVERAIEQAFRRGAGAYYSGGHRPGATARNWSVARVASLVVGGKTTVTADADLYRSFPAPLRAAIEAGTDEVVRALLKQGREKDAAFVRR